MEQMSFDFEDNKSNCEIIQAEIEKMIADVEYLKYLFVTENKDKTISIKAKSYLAAKIKLGKKASYIEFKEKYKDVFGDLNCSSSANSFLRVRIENLNDALSYTKQLCVLYMKTLFELGDESFGCCHRYVQCSDAKKCLHPNLMTALACAYKRNLESGRIFYGKNKTIL